MSKEVQTFSGFLANNKDLLKSQIAAALPKHMNADRMLRILTTEMRRVPDLNKCTLQSVLSSIMQASQLGLEVSSLLGHGYLLPFNKKDKNSGKFIKECMFLIGYRGMIDLARRSGQLSTIMAQAVYENDHFDFQYGLNEKLDHIPCQGERGGFICVYAIARFKDGSYQFVVMFKNEIDLIRKRSKSADIGPWVSDYPEMAKKTVIRRLFKYLPISIEIHEMIVNQEMKEVKDAPQDMLPSFVDEFQQEESPKKLSDDLANKIEQSYEDKKSGEISNQQ